MILHMNMINSVNNFLRMLISNATNLQKISIHAVPVLRQSFQQVQWWNISFKLSDFHMNLSREFHTKVRVIGKSRVEKKKKAVVTLKVGLSTSHRWQAMVSFITGGDDREGTNGGGRW